MNIRLGAVALGGAGILAAVAYGTKTLIANRHFITSQHISAELLGVGCALTIGSYLFTKGVMQLNLGNHEDDVKRITNPISIAGDIFQNTAPMILAVVPFFRHFLQAETPPLLKAGVSLGLVLASCAVVYYVDYLPAQAGVEDDLSASKVINTLIKCVNIYTLYQAAFRTKQLDKLIGGALAIASLASMIITFPISKETLFRRLGVAKKLNVEPIDMYEEGE